MELKFGKGKKETSLSRSNCTFMELKLKRVKAVAGIVCSNRTFMELKWEKRNFIGFELNKVLIVPLWN